jgi:hypothetical protein
MTSFEAGPGMPSNPMALIRTKYRPGGTFGKLMLRSSPGGRGPVNGICRIATFASPASEPASMMYARRFGSSGDGENDRLTVRPSPPPTEEATICGAAAMPAPPLPKPSRSAGGQSEPLSMRHNPASALAFMSAAPDASAPQCHGTLRAPLARPNSIAPATLVSVMLRCSAEDAAFDGLRGGRPASPQA